MRVYVVLVALALLAGCSGSNDPVNNNPTISVTSPVSINEGVTDVTTVTVADPDSQDTLVVSLNGADAALFSINASNQISFNAAQSFAAPADADGNNQYLLTISVSDRKGGTASANLVVNVLNLLTGRVVDPPLSGSSVFLDLNGNLVQDTDESAVTTDADGNFSLLDTANACPGAGICSALLVAVGGTDIATGQVLANLVLYGASSGDTAFIVSPVSTLLHSTTDDQSALTALGLAITPEQAAFIDPWAGAEANDPTAIALLRVNQQIGLLIQTARSIQAETVAPSEVTRRVIEALATTVSAGAVNLADQATISSLLQTAAATALADPILTAVSQTLADTNRILASSELDVVSNTGKSLLGVAQGQLQASVISLVAGTVDSSQFTDQSSADDLLTIVSANLPTPLTDTDADGVFDIRDTDDDGDGVADISDALPLDSTETVDTDGDGIGNNADTDDDGDGVADASDAFPLDRTETLDTDGDGIGNNADTDDDGDGVADASDAFPLDKTETLDTDGDGIGNNADTDDDGDGVADASDTFPLDRTETLDTDVDGIGNNADTDDDGDGVADASDALPLDRTETLDTDGDGIGNNADTDDDGDGVTDASDAFPLGATESIDTDADGIGNNADTDDDGDGVADTSDAFPLNKNETLDTDGDGIGNNADTDDDGDGVADASDALPLDRTETLDTDGDGIGNNADTDDDGDGVADASDAFPLDKTETLDTDGDGIGNNADTDDDGDGVADASDTFPLDRTETLDTDVDGIGNNADTDDDGDGVTDASDAFPLDKNETLDTDSDGIGNNADTDDDGDGIPDVSDPNPLVALSGAAPTASPASLSVNLLPSGRTTQTGTLSATSPDNLPLTYSITQQGALGVVTLTNATTGTFSYETGVGVVAAGTDTFSWSVTDGSKSALSQATVTLNTDPLYQHQWHLDNTGQRNFALNAGTAAEDLNVDSVITSGLTGRGVIVAVLDEGLELAHEDLVDNIVAGGSHNFVTGSDDPTTTAGTSGDHGTSVAGLVAARGWNNKGGRGVAPYASLKGFNILKAQFVADDVASLGGATYSADVAIFNQSFGVDSLSYVPPLSSIVEDQFKAGVTSLRGGKGAIYVRSSGNGFVSFEASSVAADCAAANAINVSCQNAVMDPSMALPQNITVAALNADGVAASYSSAGASVWIAAFGGEDGRDGDVANGALPTDQSKPAMMTTDETGCTQGYVRTNNQFPANVFENAAAGEPANNPNCSYTSTFNGTSSAAPVLSGAIALLLEARPELTWRDVKHVLQRTARQVDASRAAVAVALGDGNYIAEPAWTTNASGVKFHNAYGFGAVDIAPAVALAKTMTPNNLGTLVETAWTASGAVNVAIADNSIAGATSTIAETSNLSIEAVRIAVNISHPSSGDLGVELISPSGTRSVLFTIRNGFGTSDDLKMELMSNAFYEESSNGTWTLKVVDGKTPDGGTLLDWSIKIYGH